MTDLVHTLLSRRALLPLALWPLMQSITDALQGKDLSSVDHDAIARQLQEQLRKTTIHWSQSGKGPETKISSIEWAITSVLKDLPEVAA